MNRYFLYYIQDHPRPIPKFMAEVIESVQGPEKRMSKSCDEEPWNWLPRLKFFENDFFLAAAGLLILRNISKGTQCSPVGQPLHLVLMWLYLILCRASEGEADALRERRCHPLADSGRG